MKIIITQSEMKSSFALVKRLGICATGLEVITNMEVDSEIKVSEFVAKFDIDTANYLARETFEASKFSSISKRVDDNGVVLYEIVISEEFISDSNELFGGLLESMFIPMKGVIKTVLMFVSTNVKSFTNKWNLK